MKVHHDTAKSLVYITAKCGNSMLRRPWDPITMKWHQIGTGFCISFGNCKYIITNAHVVYNNIGISVRHETSEWISAHIVYIAYEFDLALLAVDSPIFLKTIEPITVDWSYIPPKGEKVYVYGFPHGDVLSFNPSITKGIISRISIMQYMYMYNGIVIQIDAAINNGNSGGPVVDKAGYLVGVSVASHGNNMDYIVPIFYVKFFLESFAVMKQKTGTLPGVAVIGASYRSVVNNSLRKYYKLPKECGGCIILNDNNGLKVNEIFTAIDGIPISIHGTISFDSFLHMNGFKPTWPDEQIRVGTYLSTKHIDGLVKLTVWNGNLTDIDVKLLKSNALPIIFEKRQYYILLGMVFLPLSLDLIQEKTDNGENMQEMVSTYDSMSSINKGSQTIILSEVVYDEFVINNAFPNLMVDKVNDKKIDNIEHFTEIVNNLITKKNFIIISYSNTSVKTYVDPADVIKHDDNIRHKYIGNVPRWST